MIKKCNLGGWIQTLCDPIGYRRIFPADDLYEHKIYDCWCQPVADSEDPGLLVHNSADKREEYEEGRRKLN